MSKQINARVSMKDSKYEKVSPFSLQEPGDYSLTVIGHYFTEPESEVYEDHKQEVLHVKLAVSGREEVHTEMLSAYSFHKDLSFEWKDEYTPTKAQLKGKLTAAQFSKFNDDAKKKFVFYIPKDGSHVCNKFTKERLVHVKNTKGVMARKISQFLGAFVDGDTSSMNLDQCMDIAQSQKRVVKCKLDHSTNEVLEIKKYITVKQ